MIHISRNIISKNWLNCGTHTGNVVWGKYPFCVNFWIGSRNWNIAKSLLFASWCHLGCMYTLTKFIALPHWISCDVMWPRIFFQYFLLDELKSRNSKLLLIKPCKRTRKTHKMRRWWHYGRKSMLRCRMLPHLSWSAPLSTHIWVVLGAEFYFRSRKRSRFVYNQKRSLSI